MQLGIIGPQVRAVIPVIGPALNVRLSLLLYVEAWPIGIIGGGVIVWPGVPPIVRRANEPDSVSVPVPPVMVSSMGVTMGSMTAMAASRKGDIDATQ